MRYELDQTDKRIALVNSPDFLHKLFPLVNELADIIKIPGISAQSMFSYLLYSGAETWVALKNNNPIGFVTFQVLGPPYYSTGTWPFFYMQDKDPELTEQMYGKFVEFLQNHKLLYCTFNTQIKKLGEHFKEKLKGFDIEILKVGHVYTGKRIIRRK